MTDLAELILLLEKVFRMVQIIQWLMKRMTSRRLFAPGTARPLHEVLESRRLLSGYTLSTFASFDGTNGEFPRGGLVADSAGNLYGTTLDGGAYNSGAVVEI